MKSKDNSTAYRAVKVPVPFSVSVTGHRSLCFSDQFDTCIDTVTNILSLLGEICRKYDPVVDLRLNSALAVGADQIAAMALNRTNQSIRDPFHRWSLQVILPFERTSYEAALELGLSPANSQSIRNEFATLHEKADRVYELADRECIADFTQVGAASRYWQNTRYQTLGYLLSRQADILLALWNGEDGGKGGTADVVAMALRQGKPVLRINPESMALSWLMPHDGSTDPIALVCNPTTGPATAIDELLVGPAGIEALVNRLLTLPDQPTQRAEAVDLSDTTSAATSDADQLPDKRKSTCTSHKLKPAPVFSTATAFLGSDTLSSDPWDDTSPDSHMPRFGNRFLNWLMRFKRTRSLITAQSFPGKAGATTSAFIYQLLVDSVTASSDENINTRERSGSTKESDDPLFPKKRSLSEITHLRTDYALDTWILQPEEDRQDNSTARRPGHIDLIDEHLKPAMISTDAIATARGHMYRSSYVLTFLGGTVAVWIGLTGIFFKDAKHWFVLIELLLLFALTGFYYLAKARSWHSRWLNARHITESLRAGRFLVWLGLGGRRTLNKDAPWSAWYTNAVMSTATLPNHQLQNSDINYLALELQRNVQEQITYHTGNHTKLNTVHHRLDRIGFYCLVATIITATIYVAGSLSPFAESFKWMKNPVTLLGAGLPALAGALLGIRFQADFERFADRSDQTSKELEDINKRLSALAQRQPATNAQPLFEELILIVQDMSEVFEKDIEDWRFVYSARPNPEAA